MGNSVKNLVNPAHLPGMPGGSMNPMKPFGSSVDPSNPMNPLGIGQGSSHTQVTPNNTQPGSLQNALMQQFAPGAGTMQQHPTQVPGPMQSPFGPAGGASHLMPPTMYPGGGMNQQPPQQPTQPSMGLSQGMANPFARPMVN
jgi:hypothetical protein